MPKISTKYITVETVESGQNSYAADIFYDSHNLFHAKIPVELEEIFDLLTEKEQKALHAGLKIAKNGHSKIYNFRMVNANTEKDCEQRLYILIRELASKSMIKRDVIIIYFSKNSYYNSFTDSNEEHPTILIDFALAYCVETRFGNNNPQYCRFVPDYFDKKKLAREKVSIDKGDKNIVVIDDTPDARAGLERIYSLLNELRDKLSEFTTDGESVMKLLSTNLKLLTP